jgi:hypothetical protein
MHIALIPTTMVIILIVLLASGCSRTRVVCGAFMTWFFCIAAIFIGGGFLLRFINDGPSLARIMPTTFRVTARHVLRQSLPSTHPTTQISNLWLEDWSNFVKTTHWNGFRAESSDTCVTEAESRQQAIDNAATTLSQMAVADPAFADTRSRDAVSQSLKNEIASHLQSGEFISDQVVRKIEKSYGTLYKSYLLIDAPNSTVASLNQFARDTLSQTKSNEVTTWASTAGLFLVIVLLYAFLNAATKGYFVWKLRAAALMMLIVAVLAIFAWGS